MEVSRAFLDQLLRVTEFEPFLQYVCIPNLRVYGVRMEKLEAEAWWQSRSRKDYVYIFEWLRNEMGVQKIVRMVVEDHPVNFHSDEAIERAVKGFDIEEWDWVKPDLCSDTIKEAAKNVQDLCLHWSGNKAVLRSWSAPGGLAELRKVWQAIFGAWGRLLEFEVKMLTGSVAEGTNYYRPSMKPNCLPISEG
jgi:hypothetical protein